METTVDYCDKVSLLVDQIRELTQDITKLSIESGYEKLEYWAIGFHKEIMRKSSEFTENIYG